MYWLQFTSTWSSRWVTLSYMRLVFCGFSLIVSLLFDYFQLAGIVLIIYGGLSLAKITELRSILSNDHLSDTVPTIVIGIGVFIFIISFLGCCGVWQSNICLLETYSILMMLLVLTQVLLACFIFLFIDDIQKDSVSSFNKLWITRSTNINSLSMVEMIEENLECCGSRGYTDYIFGGVPKSCCPKSDEICTTENAFKNGCQLHLEVSIRTASNLISYVCLGAAIFELFAAILAFALSGYIRKVHSIRRCCLWNVN